MDNATWITLWIASGAFIGGVMTPLLTTPRRFNDWIATVMGTIVGAVGNVVGLLPLWGALWLLSPEDDDPRLLWERDDVTAEEAERALAETAKPDARLFLTMLAANFWPKPRTEGHSHRREYVMVAIALALLTAIEVGLTFVGASWVTGPLVALSTVKVVLVVGYFMHLIYDSKWYAALFVVTLPFAALILVVLALA